MADIQTFYLVVYDAVIGFIVILTQLDKLPRKNLMYHLYVI